MGSWHQLAGFVEALSPLGREAVIAELQGGGGAGLAAGQRQVLTHLKEAHGEGLLLAMRGAMAATERAERKCTPATLVWTGMEGVRVPIRLTAQVVDELIAGTEHSILIVGYSLTRGAGFWEDLADLPTSVDVNIIGHNLEENTSRLGGHLQYLRELFSLQQHRLHLYTYTPTEGDYTKLHAKILVSDRKRGLVTSANFTTLGMSRNIEVGVTVAGRQAEVLWGLFEQLIRNGVLVECPNA